MIFGRKKDRRGDEADDRVESAVEGVAEDDPAPGVAEDHTDVAGDPDTDLDWAAFDLSRDWRAEGPYDFEEVDLDEDEIERLDFGSMIVTPPPNCEIRLQVAEGTETIMSVLVVVGESAIELSAFAAPRTPGLWAEIRDQIIEQTLQTGGSADCVQGPFATELIRNVPVQLSDGKRAFQPSRTWVAEGPRWLLRGVLMGRAALSVEIDDDVVGPLFDAFSDIIVRRDDSPMPVGELLPLSLPPQVQKLEQLPQQQS